LTFEALRRAEAHALARAEFRARIFLIKRLVDLDEVEVLRTLAADAAVRAPDIGDVVKATPWR
jgi:hypothetical protein